MTEIYGAESFAISDSLSSGIRGLYPCMFSVESGVHMQATADSIIALALCGCIAACTQSRGNIIMRAFIPQTGNATDMTHEIYTPAL